MRYDIQVQVHDGKIVIISHQKNYRREFKNMQGKIPNGTIVAIGQNLADLIRENPQNADKFREEVKFEPLYTASTQGLDNLHFFIEFQILQLRNRRSLVSRLINPESIVCSLELPDYESMDENVRKPFEFSLTKFVVRELKVNNVHKGWEKWQRRVLEISRPILLLAWPLLWYLFVIFISRYMDSLGLTIIWVVYILAFVAIYFFVVLLRVLLLKNILPHDLIRSELLNPRVGVGKFGVFLVNKFFEKK